MKKNFKSYAIIWAVLFAVFNIVVFLARPVIPGYVVSYDVRFWIAWVFIIASFAANLLCANKAFKAENLEKLFYKVPLITVSYTGLIAMLVLGGALMLIPNCPVWIAAVVCQHPDERMFFQIAYFRFQTHNPYPCFLVISRLFYHTSGQTGRAFFIYFSHGRENELPK